MVMWLQLMGQKERLLLNLKERLLLFSLLMGIVLVPINSTMISVALSPLADSLHVPLSAITWLVTVYLLVMASVQPLSGKMNDLWGRKRIFLSGVALFLVASFGCMIGHSLIAIIIFRALQAMGGAAMTPAASALIRVNWPEHRLDRTLSIMSLVLGLGAALGPILGAALLNLGSWRWLFAVNIPFAVMSFMVGYFVIPESRGKAAVVDWLGALFLLGSLLGGVLFVMKKIPFMWSSALLWIVWMALFFRRQQTTQYPLIQLKLFRNIGFTVANLSILLSNFTMYATLLITPIVLENRFQVSLRSVGMYLFIFSLSMSILSGAGARLSLRMGPIGAIGTSFAAAVLSSLFFWVCLSMMKIDSIPLWVILFILGGAASGAGIVSMQTLSLKSVDKTDSGSASGVYSTFRYMGSILASVVIASYYEHTAVVFLGMAGMSLIGLMMVFASAKKIYSV